MIVESTEIDQFTKSSASAAGVRVVSCQTRPGPRRSMAAGARFWTTTPAFATRAFVAAMLSTEFKFRATDSLERFSHTNELGRPSTVSS